MYMLSSNLTGWFTRRMLDRDLDKTRYVFNSEKRLRFWHSVKFLSVPLPSVALLWGLLYKFSCQKTFFIKIEKFFQMFLELSPAYVLALRRNTIVFRCLEWNLERLANHHVIFLLQFSWYSVRKFVYCNHVCINTSRFICAFLNFSGKQRWTLFEFIYWLAGNFIWNSAIYKFLYAESAGCLLVLAK